MKNPLLALLGLTALVLGDAGVLEAAQRGSRGSSVSPSRGASVSPSRGSSSRASSQGSRGSSVAPRPSGGSPRPSVSPAPARPSIAPAPSRPATSIRPSLPPSVRPSSPQIRPDSSSRVAPPVLPGYPGARPSPSTGSLPGQAGAAPTLGGSDLYRSRGLANDGRAGAPGGSILPDGSAPSAGPVIDAPIPTQRTQPRVRFPTPYSPAGASRRDTAVQRSLDLAPRDRSVAPGRGVAPAPGASRAPDPASLSSRGVRASGDRAPARDLDPRDPLVRYDRGPTRRVDPPRESAPKPIAPSVRSKTAPSAARTGSAAPAGPLGKGGVRPSAARDTAGERRARGTTVTAWRDVKRSDPQASKEIFVATRLASRGHALATGVAVGAIGGVYPGSWRGGGFGYYDPWGRRGWSGWSWSWHCGVSASGWWWSYPCYWAWYYPCWWWYSRPYYAIDYVYYPATTVVYADPQVVYVERGADYVEEPVGEAVVQRAAPAAAPESPLSIAAQRYLELGDRAFREGRYTDAVQFYAKAVEFAPDQGALYLVLSDALFAAGDYHYGAYAIRRALELDPALVESQVDKHAFYPDPAQFDEQIATLERYLDQNPTDRDARLVLALNYLFGGRSADAARLIEGHSATLGRDAAAQQVLAAARASAGR